MTKYDQALDQLLVMALMFQALGFGLWLTLHGHLSCTVLAQQQEQLFCLYQSVSLRSTDTRIRYRSCSLLLIWIRWLKILATMSVANHAKHVLAQSLVLSKVPVDNIQFQQILECLRRPCPVTGKVLAVFQRVLSCFSYYTTWFLKKRQVMRSPFYVLALRRYESP